ncbi:MAG: outer membrane beta-barrel protein [Candidatus Nitrotoga sp.]
MFVIPSAYAVFGMDSAVYIGASAGQAKYKDTPGVLRNRDDKDTGYKVYLGTQINPIFGVEATYYDLGKYSGNSSAFNGATFVPTNISGDATAWGLAAVITAPTNLTSVFGNSFGLFGKLGVVRSRLSTDVSGLGFSSHQNERSTGANFGVGVKYDFAKNFSVRAEWERLNNVGDNSATGATKINFLSAGVAFKF